MADGRISDDWSEIDEVASIVSFSSDDDDQYSPRVSPLHPSPSPTPSPLFSSPTQLRRSLPTNPPAAPPSPSRSASPAPVPAPSLPRNNAPHDAPSSPDADADAPTTSLLIQNDPTPQINTSTSNASQSKLHDTNVQDDADTSDPNSYYQNLARAIASLQKTAEKADRLGASRISTLAFIHSTCQELLKHTQELESILATYARYWKDGFAEVDENDMPLNPSLLEWISHLRGQLFNAQAEMDQIPVLSRTTDEPLESRLSAKSIPLHVNVSLAGCAESLEDALTTIEDFMPIFKTDFDEAQTRRMNIPTKPVGEHTSQPRRAPPNPNVARLRQEMYGLKDKLVEMAVVLISLCDFAPPNTLCDAPAVIKRLNGLVVVITTLLTNNASEWFEAGMQHSGRRIISYPEFLALDAEVISDIANNIGELYGELVVDERDLVTRCTEQMARNHQIVLLTECGQLQQILSIAEFVESLVLSTA